ncbi:Oidioi.mRNA.OKI2018_I69.chr1.g1070.t1.cds [Oikopleura dioica]|uniref:Oidioi.mRNA.OKI2018_I69.chr1.g1070.t1.cds n=1 Tax=Oikopleura dioica TaxID=34765 RepID=A0ABN7SNJ4_OIKDI|nr:Oidioi.mRNA.OKI2018_I69.chr1.g1070.t1.cds [Oikopleura dioica]
MKASIIFAAAASASSTVQVLEGNSGTWSSPGYPNGYSKGVTKSYAKSVAPREILVLDFVDFDIEMDADCAFDYLKINGEKHCNKQETNIVNNGATTTAPATTTTENQYFTTFAAQEAKPSIYIGEDLDAVFRTDALFEYRGFQISYRLLDACDSFFNNVDDETVAAKRNTYC